MLTSCVASCYFHYLFTIIELSAALHPRRWQYFLEKDMSTYWTTSTMLEYLLGRYGLFVFQFRIYNNIFNVIFNVQHDAAVILPASYHLVGITTSSKSQKSDEYELNRYIVGCE